MQKHFSRLVGIAVIMIVVLAASLLVWALSIADRPVGMWNPIEVHIGRLWTTFYSSELPDLSILVFSVAAAVILVLLVVLGERLVTWRYRRTPIGKSSRPLAPKAVMGRTRGVYAGPVTVTVLIPAHNEEASLPYTLKALEEQSFAPSRIIVVADNCTDRTVQVAGEHGVEVFESVDNKHKKGGALNQALHSILPGMGDNDCVMVMDADSQIGADFLATARDRFTWDRALMAVGGLFHGEEGHGLIGQFQRNEYTRYQREISRRDGRVFVLTGTASVFRASALREVAAARGSLLPGTPGEVYDTAALTEDNELTIALKTLGALTTSPQDCTVVTELMPNWKMLWAQRLRWQRGALENLGAYGVTAQTSRYWAQQVGIGYGVIALFSYFALMIIMLISMDTWVWFPFWMLLGALFALERVVTVWRGGWKARIVAALVIPELVYDAFLDLAFLKGVGDIAFARSADWKHVDHAGAARKENIS
ncbi:UNVERIFIED_CONTAM: glycosyltransferase family 2 protein [Actinomycetes bacterium ARC8]|nr:glycosyltransferase family 2 protein [Actinomycetes bacterium ARC8]